MVLPRNLASMLFLQRFFAADAACLRHPSTGLECGNSRTVTGVIFSVS